MSAATEHDVRTADQHSDDDGLCHVVCSTTLGSLCGAAGAGTLTKDCPGYGMCGRPDCVVCEDLDVDDVPCPQCGELC